MVKPCESIWPKENGIEMVAEEDLVEGVDLATRWTDADHHVMIAVTVAEAEAMDSGAEWAEMMEGEEGMTTDEEMADMMTVGEDTEIGTMTVGATAAAAAVVAEVEEEADMIVKKVDLSHRSKILVRCNWTTRTDPN